jgi:hypothetical protein
MNTLRTLTLALLGAAIFAAPALAAGPETGDYGGTWRYIGPGASSAPDIDVYVGSDPFAPEIVPVPTPYADVPPPEVADIYVAPFDAPPVATEIVPPEDYPPNAAIEIGE